MRVVFAPDSFGGTLTPLEAAEAMAAGWRQARPDDELLLAPMSDGGEGLVLAVAAAAGRSAVRHEVEVVGPLGLPVEAGWLLLDRDVAVIESAAACGLALVPAARRDPLVTTTWGVGQLVAAALDAGARRILLGLGGSATVDGGAGALSGLGWRVTVEDGSGLKIGGGELGRVAAIAAGWVPAGLGSATIEVLFDVRATLGEAAGTFGPQKGADASALARLDAGLSRWADVLEASFDRPGLRDEPGTGAAGGLGFAFMAAHDAVHRDGAAVVAELVGLKSLLADADLVVTGEGRFDATSLQGKVVGEVLQLAAAADCRAIGVFGQVAEDLAMPPGGGFDHVVAAAQAGPAEDAVAQVAAAAGAAARGVR